MVSLLERINIRVGNSFYEKLYGSFGLTTLKNHHVKINGTHLQLMFKGKKGVHHNITLKSRKLARIVKGCKEMIICSGLTRLKRALKMMDTWRRKGF